MRIITAGLVLLAALAIAACGGAGATATIKNSSGSGGASVSGSHGATTTVTRTATGAAPPATGVDGSDSTQSGSGGAGLPGTAPAPASGAPVCRATGLALSFLGQQGATGHGELGFALRNTGNAGCSTIGYPGMQFLDRAGGALPTTPTHTTNDFFGHTSLHPLTLAPGQSASFRLGVTHGAGSSTACTTTYAVQVIAPNDTATLKAAIPGGAAECATATVSPLVAGSAAYP
jgi:Protein of unknown function (DUF4232)